MNVRDNPAVIRIPLADPTSNKDGLLSFALPRECLSGSSEPMFYAKGAPFGDDTVTLAAPSTPAAPAAPKPRTDGSPAATLDEILSGVGRVRDDLGAISSDVTYTGFNVQRTRSDFQRAQLPVMEAEQDTPQTDSSGAGQQLSFIMWSARNSLRDTEQSNTRSSAGTENVKFDLDAARQQLTELGQKLSADPKYAAVVPLLSQADQLLDRVGIGNSSIGGYLMSGQQGLQMADSQLAFSDGQVAQIESDRPGLNVSPAAFQLQSEINLADSQLLNAGEQANLAAAETNSSTGTTDQAADVLRQAKAKLPQLR